MLKELWNKLTNNQQDVLVQKYGLTRLGAREVSEKELEKVAPLLSPQETKEEIKPKKYVKKGKGKRSV